MSRFRGAIGNFLSRGLDVGIAANLVILGFITAALKVSWEVRSKLNFFFAILKNQSLRDLETNVNTLKTQLASLSNAIAKQNINHHIELANIKINAIKLEQRGLSGYFAWQILMLAESADNFLKDRGNALEPVRVLARNYGPDVLIGISGMITIASAFIAYKQIKHSLTPQVAAYMPEAVTKQANSMLTGFYYYINIAKKTVLPAPTVKAKTKQHPI